MLPPGAPHLSAERAQVLLAQQRFPLRLSDAIRLLTDPVALEGEACRLLGEQLQVGRAYYMELYHDSGIARVARDWTR